MRIHSFNEQEFSQIRDEWQNLLQASEANPLFLSWDWMHSWWQTYQQASFKLQLIGIFENDELIALAPLYSHRVKTKKIFNSTRVEFIGSCSSGGAGFRSEYMQILHKKDCNHTHIEAILDHVIQNTSCHELYLSDLVVDSLTHTTVLNKAKEQRFYTRVQSKSTTYGIAIENSFDEYVKSLGKNSRLQLFNRRKVLNELGDFKIYDVTKDNFESSLDELGRFHLDRWGEHISYTKHKAFVGALINARAHLKETEKTNEAERTYETDRAYETRSPDEIKNVSGIQAHLDGKLIGLTFDIDCKDVRYNFQLGFQDNIDKKISMGSLTLGYGIEACYQNSNIKYYDLMAGEGKHSNYKTRFAKENQHFESLQIVRSGVFKMLYKLKDSKSD